MLTRLHRPCFALLRSCCAILLLMETITLMTVRPIAGPGTDYGHLSMLKTESKLKCTTSVRRPEIPHLIYRIAKHLILAALLEVFFNLLSYHP